MKRGIGFGLAVAVLTALGLSGPAGARPLTARPAQKARSAGGPVAPAAPAAVGRSLIVKCRAANPTCWPTSFAFAPDGRIWYIERFTGQIRVYNPKTKKDGLWKTIGPLATDGEQGLLGLALDPSFPSSPWVYVYYTQPRPVNHIVRWRRNANGSFSYKSLKWIPAGTYHNGGKIKFGPDGNLYAVTGETTDKALAQNLSSLGGKVLRMNRSGYVPTGNPFRNLVWSYGHRNSFGLAFDPVTKNLWQTENGPDCNDEINRIVKGGNFAWGPNAACPNTNNSGPSPRRLPAWLYQSIIAPTGAGFCNGCGLGPAAEGALLFGTWGDHKIRALKLTADRLGVVSSTVIYTHIAGILDMEVAPGGSVYFSSPQGIYRMVSV